MLPFLLIPSLILAALLAIEIWSEARRRAGLARAIEAREREARAQLAGNPQDPVLLESPALVEGHVRSTPCPLCGGALQVDEHAAETIGGVRLRIAYASCRECGTPRPIYFRIAGARG